MLNPYCDLDFCLQNVMIDRSYGWEFLIKTWLGLAYQGIHFPIIIQQPEIINWEEIVKSNPMAHRTLIKFGE